MIGPEPRPKLYRRPYGLSSMNNGPADRRDGGFAPVEPRRTACLTPTTVPVRPRRPARRGATAAGCHAISVVPILEGSQTHHEGVHQEIGPGSVEHRLLGVGRLRGG